MPFFVSEETSSQDLESLQKTMDEDSFYMFRFKTAYCPKKNQKHDQLQCVYAHKLQDYRRPPDQFTYEPDDCKYLPEKVESNKGST